MTSVSAKTARKALAALSEGTEYGDTPSPKQVYLPQSHMKAIDPDVSLVIGMRGAGKTFWWGALQDPDVRRLIDQSTRRAGVTRDTEVRTGFGAKAAPDRYPDKDTLRKLMGETEPRLVWRTVQAWQLAKDGHPLRQRASWEERVKYVDSEPESVAELFYDRDMEFEKKGFYCMILFDALDLCADEWKGMYRAIRGLLQTALEMRSYRRLRAKIFLRSDQFSKTEIADFPDASKILSSAVELNWPPNELYGLLWHALASGENGARFRKFLTSENWNSLSLSKKHLFSVPRDLVFDKDLQRKRFHELTCPWMGRDHRRGYPYTWIPNHLADTNGRVSPRSFLEALRTAADETDKNHPKHKYALHYENIKQGVREASEVRAAELQEDYPWVHQALDSLEGIVVPCEFDEIKRRWQSREVLARLKEKVNENEVKLPPRHLDDGPKGIRQDLESLGIFQRLGDGRVNIPDVFRVAYSLGRKGGVKPAR